MCSFQILVRWTLPRFRYDQLLRFRVEVHVPAGARSTLAVTVLVVWALRSFS
jgi:NADH-quinone oxidoreductase subunit H